MEPVQDVQPQDDEVVLRPESLLLTFYGAHVLGRPVMVATPSLIDVMERVGVSPHATRSAIARMVTRGRLVARRRGRQVYYGLTAASIEVLNDGYVRIWRTGAVNRHWDGRWTLLSFKLPESWQRQRHELRTRLLWAGFGPLQGGLWIAPSVPDLDRILSGLEAAEHVRAFVAQPHAAVDVAGMLGDVWDIPGLARRYERFLERWDGGVADRTHTEPLGRLLALQEEWRLAMRQEPHLPVELLPQPWPAERAQELFHRLHAEMEVQARAEVARVLDTIPVTEGEQDAADVDGA
ncbi:PaaX family transcriptional regulator C-terminal domain-containing protein [Blastococcus brunescens]|uniref:PaaX family transcriptional regulator C-terminal domain-containing protein n=1 Tax=Blastococcus brunescens TaxID=1564165 RepID=A0ABZ1B7G7_9ACTN|nr:PaaX family transcriptional regulator C-terminal domain-containing protein [Blastococcus sp. BMG 8361]WRL66762.1 PaaX family transcriptional regulator C-terminal domain-containing protein [Blastococcus sp. BMG 8361]